MKRSRQQILKCESTDDFISKVTSGGRAQIISEFEHARRRERHINLFKDNLNKCRYGSVVLFDEGAVLLKRDKSDSREAEFIHATRIQTKFGTYIIAQSPLEKTLVEWFRMIWQFQIHVIVCVTPLERMEHCATYFLREDGGKLKVRNFTIRTLTKRKEGPCVIYDVKIFEKASKTDRTLRIIHFDSWRQAQCLPDPKELIGLMQIVMVCEQLTSIMHDISPPTLIHGVSGTRRSGTYLLITILCKQILKTGAFSLISTCKAVRRYRYNVLRYQIHFVLMLEAILYFATTRGLIDKQSDAYKTTIEILHKAMVLASDQMIEERTKTLHAKVMKLDERKSSKKEKSGKGESGRSSNKSKK